jgi:hypothetical protein
MQHIFRSRRFWGFSERRTLLPLVRTSGLKSAGAISLPPLAFMLRPFYEFRHLSVSRLAIDFPATVCGRQSCRRDLTYGARGEDRSRLVARQWRRAEARPSNGSLAAEERGNRKIASGISGAIAPSANRQKPGAGERRRVRERLSSAQARHRAFSAATAVETPKFLPNRELTDFEHAAHAFWRGRDRRRAELSRARGLFGGATIGSHIAIRRSTVPRHRLSPNSILSVTLRA